MPVAVLLVAVAAVSQGLGAAFAVKLFSALDPLGAVFARPAVSAAVLYAVMRQRLLGLPRRSWFSAAVPLFTQAARWRSSSGRSTWATVSNAARCAGRTRRVSSATAGCGWPTSKQADGLEGSSGKHHEKCLRMAFR
jgi:hypothetical protein